MSLKFVTRKLKTQTLGDDEGEHGPEHEASQNDSVINTLSEDKNKVIVAGGIIWLSLKSIRY